MDAVMAINGESKNVVRDDKNGSTIASTSRQRTTIRPSKFIQAGDLVIIFTSRDKPPVPITITPGQELNNAYGNFLHDAMVGLPFGAKVASRNAKGFIHILRPNPELWTLALPHRTQILYTPDMSFIAAHLGLTPGAKVIEAGTGSGSFSHYLTRTVGRYHEQSRGVGWKGKAVENKGQDRRGGQQRRGGGRDRSEEIEEVKHEDSEEEEQKREPINQKEAEVLQSLSKEPDVTVDVRDGRVWSFEFHAGRAVKAWNEFEDHGLFPTLSLRHRNVSKVGFGLEGMADAVFLDLPAPWEVLQHAAKALRNDIATRICCFSPCVEQVLKTVAELRRGGNASRGDDQVEARWVDIETYECLNRTHMTIWAGSGGQTSNAPIEEVISRIRSVEERKEKRREAQIEKVKRERAQRLQQAGSVAVVEGEEDAKMEEERGEEQTGEEKEQTQTGEKRKRDEGEQEQAMQMGKGALTTNPEPVTARTRDGKTIHRANVYARTFPEMKGHTSYLTFATLLPRVVRQELDPTLEREKENERRKIAGQERARLRKAEKEAEEAKAAEDKVENNVEKVVAAL